MPILTDTYVVSSSIEMDLSSKVVASTSSSSSCTTSTGIAGELLQLSLTTDTYPAETSWTIVNECTGLTELTSPTYEGSTTTYNDEYCLAIGMEYTFTISDSYSDGMCCSYGNGSYDLMYGGVVIKEPGGEFGSSESTTFGSQCLTSSPTTSVSVLRIIRHILLFCSSHNNIFILSNLPSFIYYQQQPTPNPNAIDTTGAPTKFIDGPFWRPGGPCMNSVFQQYNNNNLQCTAKEVEMEATKVEGPDTCEQGTIITVNITANVYFHASRYDLAFYTYTGNQVSVKYMERVNIIYRFILTKANPPLPSFILYWTIYTELTLNF